MAEAIVFDGGSEADRAQILQVHRDYLEANGKADTDSLRKIWSADPTNVFFNLNGHTYVGLEQQWAPLWDHYRPRLKTIEPWVSDHVKVVVRGDMAAVTCHRVARLRWVGEGVTPDFSDRPLRSRSTEVLVRERGQWKVIHAHFSVANDGPRPGGI